MNGKDIIVYSGSTAIAATTVNDISNAAELQPFSSPNTADYKEYRAKDKSWRIITNYLVTSSSGALTDLLKVGNTYTLVIGATGQTASSKQGLTGSAICQECRIVATNGNLCTGSFVFQGSGPLTQTSQS